MNHPSDQRGKSRGAAMIEALIAVPITVVACLLVLQIMLLYRVKIALNHATQEAARVGSMSNARVIPRFLTDIMGAWSAMGGKGGGKKANPVGVSKAAAQAADGTQPKSAAQDAAASGGSQVAKPADKKDKPEGKTPAFMKAFGKGLMRYGDSSVLQGFINGITPLYVTGTSFLDVTAGQLKAYGDAMLNSCIFYHNPTQAAFIDHGFMEPEGPDRFILQIPNDFMRYRVPARVDFAGKGIGYFKKNGKYLSDEEERLKGYTSSMSIQDATLLSIEIRYSAEMKVPLAKEIILGITKLYNAVRPQDPNSLGQKFDADAIDNGRWPMRSFATYRMRSPVHWHILYPMGGMSNAPDSQVEVFNITKTLWNQVSSAVGGKFDPAEPQIGFCPGLVIETEKKFDSDQWVGKKYDVELSQFKE
jgi:hypothetical protein